MFTITIAENGLFSRFSTPDRAWKAARRYAAAGYTVTVVHV